ncbi:MAG TPA: amidohydrolase family protein, partial [Candidatus Binatia bacterium]
MKAIDIHHHYVPQQLIEETKKHGKALGVEVTEDKGSWALSFAGSKPHRLQPPIFDVEGHLEIMDRGQVGLATLEANTNSLGYRLNGAQGEAWCNLYNDCINLLAQQRPDRFIGMAVVPLQDAARAAKVLEHAIVDLKFRGAFIGTNVNSQYYNVTDFDPFWAKAQELDIMIVMHPEHIAGAERMNQFGLNAVCGNPADSTLSLGYMFYSGLFDRFPNLKICALHGGGFLPFHLGRFNKEFVTGQKTRPAQAKYPPSFYLKN